MLRVGLTGGLGSGKSTVAAFLRNRGAQVIEADELGRKMMEPGQQVYSQIVTTFGPDVLNPDATLNRARLAKLAFEGGRLSELNAIVHPAVIAAQQQWMEEVFARDPSAVAVVESALIFGVVGDARARGESDSVLANWRRRIDRVIVVDTIDTVHLRVGALPEFPSNFLNYNLTWSTDGLINEYCNPCQAIHEGRRIDVLPLEGLETFSLDGICYEAFNTSGGLGTLCETMAGRVRELNYRTIRYSGHRCLMKFLIEELRLGQRRELLKDILENAVPITFQDVVVIFCSVVGRRAGQLVQLSDARKIYQCSIDGRPWSAIQITTAAGVCTALDLHMKGRLPESGFVRQEQVDFNDFINDRFGHWYASKENTRAVDSRMGKTPPCASCTVAVQGLAGE